MRPSVSLLFVGHILACYASSVEITANFDNLTASPVPLASIGTYESVIYNAFSLATTGDSVTGGVPAHTAPNAIDTNSEQQSTNGTPFLAPAKPYTSIGLIDFWFGCTIHTGQGAVVLPTQCTITVAGFNSKDQEVAVASYTFTPPAGVAAVPMIEAVLPNTFGVSGISNVTIVQGNPVTQSLLVDSVTYYLYK